MKKKKNRYEKIIEEYDKRTNALTMLRDVLTLEEYSNIRARIGERVAKMQENKEIKY